MRSVVYERFGDPAEVLRLGERPMPEPGPGQVRVRLTLSPIHNHDLMTIAGHYGSLPSLPAVPGTEAVGVVEAVGDGVTNLRPGQRVAGGAAAIWAESYLVDARRAVPVPDSIGDETAAQLISMPLSARLLLEVMGVKRGDWIIQNAANGAVGKLLVGFGADLGVNVVGLVRRDAGIAELAEAGIGNIVSTETAGWQERVRAVTGGAPIVRGLESIGGKAADEMLGVMAEGSTIYSFGALSGRPLQVSAENLLFKQAKIEGFWMARLGPTTPPEVLGRLIGEIVTKAASGRLVLPVGGIFGLEQVAEAAVAATEPGRSGKVMLRG
jgi:NADPH:quinone reductase